MGDEQLEKNIQASDLLAFGQATIEDIRGAFHNRDLVEVLNDLLEATKRGLGEFIVDPSLNGYGIFHEDYFDEHFIGDTDWLTVVEWIVPALKERGFKAEDIQFFTDVSKTQNMEGIHIHVPGFDFEPDEGLEFHWTADDFDRYRESLKEDQKLKYTKIEA